MEKIILNNTESLNMFLNHGSIDQIQKMKFFNIIKHTSFIQSFHIRVAVIFVVYNTDNFPQNFNWSCDYSLTVMGFFFNYKLTIKSTQFFVLPRRNTSAVMHYLSFVLSFKNSITKTCALPHLILWCQTLSN